VQPLADSLFESGITNRYLIICKRLQKHLQHFATSQVWNFLFNFYSEISLPIPLGIYRRAFITYFPSKMEIINTMLGLL
jgi:hypothetical protein